MRVRLCQINSRLLQVFAASLVVAMLAGCGSGNGGSGNDSGDAVIGSGGNGSTNPGSGNGTEAGTGTGSGQNPEVEPGTVTPVDPPTDTETAIEKALRTGDTRWVDDADDLLQAALASIEEGRTLLQSAIFGIYNLQADGSVKADGSSLTDIDWNPTHDAATLIATFGENTNLLYTNSVTQSDKTVHHKSIGVIGEAQARYLVLGGNPMRNHQRSPGSVNSQMHQLLQNSLAWLTGIDDLTSSPFNVTLAQMANGYYFPDESATRAWLDEFYTNAVKYNAPGSCDDDQLAACLAAGTDLLIISQDMNDASNAPRIASAVAAAMASNTPVLYLHLDGNLTELGAALFGQFNIGYEWDNYWKKLQLENFNATEFVGELSADIASVKTMLGHLLAQSYAFDWSACDGENCNAVSGLDEMQNAASYVRTLMNGLDQAKRNLFAEQGFELQKLLALSGDHLRQSTVHPMDKLGTDDNALVRAWFADHAVYYSRSLNPVQADMGNFSRSDFSHITPVSKVVNLQSKRNFRAAGVYALPGQTVTVTRSDNSVLTVKLFVNTQRAGSTHQWAENGYNRPKYLQSPRLQINSGETIQFTTPYGGPIQVEFSDNDLPVQLRFEDIGQHPYWGSTEDDSSFSEQLDAGDYDWAELATPGFEVHSSLEKMRSSLVDEKWGTAEALAAGTMKYLHNFPHVLAGFQGPGIDIVDEIHSFADANGYSIDLLDMVKHMNADQATCGYGCSGNPYDAYWSFSPIGHGDVHELGHGLEKKRLRFEGWQTHTMTNPYSYYTKTQYFKTTGGEPDCQSLPFERSFSVLQESVASDDAAAYVKANLWDTMGWSEGAAMFIQMMMSAEDNGALVDGWHLLSRLHIMEREFERATRLDDAGWLTRRDALGFGQFTRSQADALSQNDWLLIAVSFAAGLDHRDYFSMWSLPYTAAAASQVSALSLPVVARNFYVSSGTGYCKGEGFDGVKLPVDGLQAWPLTE